MAGGKTQNEMWFRKVVVGGGRDTTHSKEWMGFVFAQNSRNE